MPNPADQLRAKSPDELRQELSGLRREHFNLRVQKAVQQLNKPSELRRVRRDIARALTILREKETAEFARTGRALAFTPAAKPAPAESSEAQVDPEIAAAAAADVATAAPADAAPAAPIAGAVKIKKPAGTKAKTKAKADAAAQADAGGEAEAEPAPAAAAKTDAAKTDAAKTDAPADDQTASAAAPEVNQPEAAAGDQSAQQTQANKEPAQ